MNNLAFFSNWTNSTNETNDALMMATKTPLFVRIVQAIVYIFELILGVGLSLFLILLIVFCKSLRQRNFAVAVQILVANVAFAISVLTTSAHAALAGDWMLGDKACQFIAFINQSLQPLRWLLTAVLVIDRALTINRPLKYEKHGAKVVAALSAVALTGGFLIGIFPQIFFPECNEFLEGINSCQLSGEKGTCPIYAYVYFTILLHVGGVLPFSLYIWMLCKAKNANRRIVPAPGTRTPLPQHLTLTRKQLLTIFLLFWTPLGCLLPHYIAYIISFILSNSSPILLTVSGAFIVLTQPLYYGLVIADAVALMWHNDVKTELRKIKNKLRTTV